MIEQQEVVTRAKVPSRRVWMIGFATAGVLAIGLAALWLFTPHLASDQLPEVVGVIPQGAGSTVASGADADPNGNSTWGTTNIRVKNNGPLPVTLSRPRPADVTDTGTTHRVEVMLALSGSGPYQEEIRLDPGEETFVVIRIHASQCSDSGASESLTTVKDLILRTQVGPFARDARVSEWTTQQFDTADGSALPACP